VNVIVAIGVCGGVFFVFVTQMFVAFEDGTTSGVFVGQRIAGIPQIDPDFTVIIAANHINKAINIMMKSEQRAAGSRPDEKMLICGLVVEMNLTRDDQRVRFVIVSVKIHRRILSKPNYSSRHFIQDRFQ
jgi:hypothetical protein